MTSRSVGRGLLAGAALGAFYVAVVWGASGSFDHLVDQARADWYYLALILTGFVTQVALVSELRRGHRLQHAAAVAGGAGMGASTAGMVACCAHHLADLAPFIGTTGAATFLIDFRIPFIVTGIGINTVGVIIAARRLRRVPTPRSTPHRGAGTWAHA